MFSSISTLSSSTSTSTSSKSSVPTKVLGAIQKQSFEEKIPLTPKEVVAKKLDSMLTQVQQNQIKHLNLASTSLGRFYKLAKTLNGCEGVIYSLAALENSDSCASASSFGTIKLWDLSSHSCLSTLQGHSRAVYALASLPNGQLASVSGYPENTIKLWDLVSHSCLSTLQGHTDAVLALAVLPNGQLASGSFDKTIKLWNLSNHSCLATLQGHTSWVNALALLPNGQLASGSYDYTIKLWDLTSNSCLSTLRGHADSVSALVVLPNGQLASGSWDTTIKLWDVASGTCLSTIQGHTSAVYALAVLPNGLLASGSEDKTIKLWDWDSRYCLSTLQGHTNWVRALAALPNGLLVSGSYDNTIKFWKPKTLSAKRLLPILNALKNNNSVTDLDLSYNPEIHDDIIDPLIEIFASNTTLETVNLQKTKVTPKAIEELQKALRTRSLSVTILTECSEQEKHLAQQRAKAEKEDPSLRQQKERKELEEQKKTQMEEAEVQRLQAELQKMKIQKPTIFNPSSTKPSTSRSTIDPSSQSQERQTSQPIQTISATEDLQAALISRNAFAFGKVLGEGERQFGSVYKRTYNENEEEIAIKKLLMKKTKTSSLAKFCWMQDTSQRPMAKEAAVFPRSDDKEFKLALSARSGVSI